MGYLKILAGFEVTPVATYWFARYDTLPLA